MTSCVIFSSHTMLSEAPIVALSFRIQQALIKKSVRGRIRTRAASHTYPDPRRHGFETRFFSFECLTSSAGCQNPDQQIGLASR